jgi:hypothetical protein
MYGIKETKDLFAAIRAFKEVIKQAKENDGVINFSDWVLLPALFGPLQAAVSGGQEIPKELGDLDQAEIEELTAEFGELINDPAAMQIFQGLALVADGIYDLTKPAEA